MLHHIYRVSIRISKNSPLKWDTLKSANGLHISHSEGHFIEAKRNNSYGGSANYFRQVRSFEGLGKQHN